MPSRVRAVLGSWSYALPVLAVIVFAATWGSKISGLVVVIASVLLAGAVLAAVGHAEVVAHRVGQPLGALVLAVSVTVIEVALIVTLMLSSGPDKSALARDTVFAALSLEAAGFAERGQGWRLAAEGQIGRDRRIPIQTFGGLKARGNPIGATGVYQVAEVALQVRGEAGASQVPNARVGMAQCIGGIGANIVTHILQAA